jgi:hypothetical protein
MPTTAVVVPVFNKKVQIALVFHYTGTGTYPRHPTTYDYGTLPATFAAACFVLHVHM